MTAVDWPAIGYAAAAALVFAVANNLQRDAASVVPLEVGGPVRLVLRLFTRPRWLFGSTLALAALGLHAVALARGGVILVQAVLATGLIAAVIIEAAQERTWLRSGELGGALVLVAGVTLLLGWGRPGGGRPVDLSLQLTAAAGLAVVAAIGLTASRMHHRVRLSAVVMGGAAGACFALDAMFLKGVANWTDDLDALPATISLGGFVVASVFGNLIVQRAFQRAPLRLVLPTVTAADPIAAFIIGRVLLHEQLEGGTGAGTAVVVGLCAMVTGIALTITHGRASIDKTAHETDHETADGTDDDAALRTVDNAADRTGSASDRKPGPTGSASDQDASRAAEPAPGPARGSAVRP